VDCAALAIEELKAVAGVLDHRVRMLPQAEEHPQVDVGSEDHADHAVGLDVLIAAVALVHAPVVARQRHDPAEAAEQTEYFLRRPRQLDRLEAAVGSGQLRFGDAQAAGAIADAKTRFGSDQSVVALPQFVGTAGLHIRFSAVDGCATRGRVVDIGAHVYCPGWTSNSMVQVCWLDACDRSA
jgi:hypothetical protein